MKPNFSKIRAATGKSQAAFAELIGVSLDTVSSIDCGRLAVSWEVAKRVQAKTGAIAADIMDGEPVIAAPRAWHGGLYSTADFHAWRAGTELVENTDRFLGCVAGFIRAVPVERRAEVQAHFAQLMCRPEFEGIANEACRVQRASGNYDFEDLRGFTARVNQ
ncbi:MAG TPA: hypothetical protein VL200_09855 [Lacunisphaera sp.]|jgi:DNA-binding XRE family transcriptional regulator|nr:hypothetical protein [Lacunisphaera sp.]